MSYLAAPPAVPIEIDAGSILYYYVIAQQGAQAITVTPDPDFTFIVTMGEPAMLSLIYIGAIPTTPLFKTVNINIAWRGGGGTVQSVLFSVLPQPPATRQIPNIKNHQGQNVTPGQAFDMAILTDIPVDSYGSYFLPGGLALNTTTGRITGTVPVTSGFYVIGLQANLGGKHMVRYFVLVVGSGYPPEPPPPPPPVPFSPQIFLDGDFTEAQLSGPAEYEIPFKTDPKPYVYKLKYWVLRDHFSEPPLGNAGPLGGFYCGASSGTIKAIGGGVIEFERRFAIVPDSRNEYESFVYNYHLQFFTLGLPNLCFDTFPLTVNSRLQFDYFLGQPSAIPLPRAPTIVNTCLGFLGLNGGISGLIPPTPGEDFEVLAEDAHLKIWEPGIYERRMRFVTVPASWSLF